MSILGRILDRLLRRDAAAPERLPRGDALVVVARPQGEPEAQMLRELLAQQGVVAMVRNRDAFSTSRGGGWGPSWAYELLVLRRDLRRAEEILLINEEEFADEE